MISKTEQTLLELINAQQKHKNRSQFQPQIIALTYLTSKELSLSISFEKTEFRLESSELEPILKDLASSNLIKRKEHTTYGGEKRVELYITEIGKTKFLKETYRVLHKTFQSLMDRFQFLI